MVLTRRRFLRAVGSVVASAAGVGAYAYEIEPHWLELVRRPLPIARLPGSLVGKTLVQISDVHVGTGVDDDYVLRAFRRVTDVRPDIVVMTGDFMSFHASSFEQLPAIYRHFPRGRIATLASLGNHDYGPAWSHPEMAKRVVDIVEPLGITVLRNEMYDVDGLQIVGLDDLWGGEFKPHEVLSRVDASRAALVLSHNPDTVDLPVWTNYQGWILSGHTHGGQCKPPFLPPPVLPVQNKRYTAGEFALSGNRRLYINRGVGHLLHVRFNVRPEVTVFELWSA